MVHILVADDQKTIRRLLTETLEEAGHDVTQAEDGRQALELCQNIHFDLVIMDYKMPYMNGLEVIRTLNGKIPFVLHTSDYENQDLRIKAMSLGALDIIDKIGNIEVYRTLIEQYLNNRPHLPN